MSGSMKSCLCLGNQIPLFSPLEVTCSRFFRKCIAKQCFSIHPISSTSLSSSQINSFWFQLPFFFSFSNHLHYCCYEVNYPFLLYIFLLSVSIFDFGSSPPLSLSRRLNTASVGGCVTECSPPLLLFCWHLLLNNSNAL